MYKSNKVRIKVVTEESNAASTLDENIFRKPATGAIEVEKQKMKEEEAKKAAEEVKKQAEEAK